MDFPLVSIGIVAYGGEKYFPFLFSSLADQDYPVVEILVLDNASPTDVLHPLKNSSTPQFQIFQSAENLGFAGGHNFLIRKMSGAYYFCLNQDIILEKTFISEMVRALEQERSAGSATGKLRRWDFEKGRDGKTAYLDTTGIQAFASHHFSDRGQGEKDFGQYDEQTEIFAASGAAAFYRKEALESVAIKHANGVTEYFDERFFMYKEDIDLGYRLQWAGWKSLFVPSAVGYHYRTAAQKKNGFFGLFSARTEKSEMVRSFSWRNQKLLIQKNFSPKFSFRIKWKTFWAQFWKGIFLRIFEPAVFAKGEILKNMGEEYRVQKDEKYREKIEKFFK